MDQVKIPNGGPQEQQNHEEGRGGRRVQEGRCLSRHFFLLFEIQYGLHFLASKKTGESGRSDVSSS